MGVNYTQICMIGICFDDVVTETSPPQYEQQARYDTQTGKVDHYEQVLIKQPEKVYQADGLLEDEFEYLVSSLEEKYNNLLVFTDWDNLKIYVGKSIGNTVDFGRADLLKGSFDLPKIISVFNELQETFSTEDVCLYLLSDAG